MFRDGHEIWASADYVIITENGITLRAVIAEDSGMYNIRASNAAGEASVTLELLVLPLGQFLLI